MLWRLISHYQLSNTIGKGLTATFDLGFPPLYRRPSSLSVSVLLGVDSESMIGGGLLGLCCAFIAQSIITRSLS